MNVNIEFDGLDKLMEAVGPNMVPVKNIVRMHGAQLQTRMQREAVFVKGYSTGATRQSIKLSYSFDGMTATVEPGTYYSPYLEYGTRYMAAQPFVGPSWREQKSLFLADLEKLVR